MSVPVVASFRNMSTSAIETTAPARLAAAAGGDARIELQAEDVLIPLGVFETPLVFAAILYIGAMSIGLFVITTLVERGVNLWLYGRPE